MDSSVSSDDYLRLEQAPWLEAPDGGFLEWMTDNDLGLSLETLQEYWSTYKSFCGDDQVLEIEIYVYRSRIDLPYTLTASYGELSEGAVGSAPRTVYENIGMASSHQLDVETDSGITASWQGEVFDNSGTSIAAPVINQLDNTLSWSEEVVGTLQLQYDEVRTVHILTITPRDNEDIDPENPDSAYESVVRAFWAGDYQELEVELPDMSGSCGGAGNTSSSGDEEQCVRKRIVVDPCTLEVKSTTTEAMVCPEEDDT